MDKPKNELVHLFPTVLWKSELPDELARSINNAVIPMIERKLQDVEQDLQGTFLQTEQNLHLAPEFTELGKYIYMIAKSALDYMHIDYQDIQITGCWANISGAGHSHRQHSHPNNFLSGVYYAEVPPGGNSIIFHDPRPQIQVMKPPVKKMIYENTDHVVAQVETGTMLLFPSWLRHSVPPNQGKDRRISISFNIMFLQFAETMSKPLWEGKL